MIVSKFGGTSVGTFKAMQHSASIVADHSDKLIVISATSGTTNDLVALENLTSVQRNVQLLIHINDRHLSIISSLKERKSVKYISEANV